VLDLAHTAGWRGAMARGGRDSRASCWMGVRGDRARRAYGVPSCGCHLGDGGRSLQPPRVHCDSSSRRQFLCPAAAALKAVKRSNGGRAMMEEGLGTVRDVSALGGAVWLRRRPGSPPRMWQRRGAGLAAPGPSWHGRCGLGWRRRDPWQAEDGAWPCTALRLRPPGRGMALAAVCRLVTI